MGKKPRNKNKTEVEMNRPVEDDKEESEYLASKKKSIKKQGVTRHPKISKKKEDNEEESDDFSKSEFQHSGKSASKQHAKSTLQILETLKKDLELLKSTLKKAENEYQEHRQACQTLSQLIKSKKESISEIERTIHTTEKDIIQKSVDIDKIFFFNPFTFKDSDSFGKFYDNLKELPEKIRACAFSSSQISIKFSKLTSGSISLFLRNIEDGSVKKKIIQEHFRNFPFIACSEGQLQLIQALVAEKQAEPELIGNQILKQFTPLFSRASSFPKRLLLNISNYIYNLIFNDSEQKIIKEIENLVKESFPTQIIQKTEIQESISKSLINRNFICLPEVHRQIRGFCFDKSIYINTYYLEEKAECLDEIKIVYCIAVWLREVCNYVFEDILTKKSLVKKQFREILDDHIKRNDKGALMEKILTGKDGFEGASVTLFKMIKKNQMDFSLFANLEENVDNFIFEQVEIKNRQKIKDISQKYMTEGRLEVEEAMEQILENEQNGNQMIGNNEGV